MGQTNFLKLFFFDGHVKESWGAFLFDERFKALQVKYWADYYFLREYLLFSFVLISAFVGQYFDYSNHIALLLGVVAGKNEVHRFFLAMLIFNWV